MYPVDVSEENMFWSYTDIDMLDLRYGNIPGTCIYVRDESKQSLPDDWHNSATII